MWRPSREQVQPGSPVRRWMQALGRGWMELGLLPVRQAERHRSSPECERWGCKR
jgi:hypothetical protein